MNRPGHCKHGWPEDYLRQQETQYLNLIRVWETLDHPFRVAGLEGARQSLACIRKHLNEVPSTKEN